LRKKPKHRNSIERERPTDKKILRAVAKLHKKFLKRDRETEKPTEEHTHRGTDGQRETKSAGLEAREESCSKPESSRCGCLCGKYPSQNLAGVVLVANFGAKL
jgi:hypothetical protein